MDYYDKLETLARSWRGKVCLFGAGVIGKTWGFDIVKCAGFKVDFYCDNKIESGTFVREKVKAISPCELYKYKENVLVFLTVSIKYQNSILEQLRSNDIQNIIIADFIWQQKIIEGILKSGDRKALERYKEIIDDKEYLTRQFKYHLGYSLNWNNPRTFNEKLQWLKLYDRKPEYVYMVDKSEAKTYIVDKIGEEGKEYLIPTLGVYGRFNEINFEELPEQFVLKCTHDSGSVVICNNKNSFNKDEAEYILTKGMERNFYWGTREWPYKNIKPRIIAEKYIVSEQSHDSEVLDYKLMCFNGKVECLFICSNRNSAEGLCVDFYDKYWNALSFTRHYPKSKNNFEKPRDFDKMIELAEKLSAGIKFIRIDFYYINQKIYLGELTLYPGAGFEEFEPMEWDYKLGKMIDLKQE